MPALRIRVGLVVKPPMRGSRADSNIDGSEAPSAKILIRSKEVIGRLSNGGEEPSSLANRRRDTNSFRLGWDRAMTEREAVHELVVELGVVGLEVRVLPLDPERDPHARRGDRQKERPGDGQPAGPRTRAERLDQRERPQRAQQREQAGHVAEVTVGGGREK